MVQVKEDQPQPQTVETPTSTPTGSVAEQCKTKIRFFNDADMDPLE